jgi:thiol-disulfide isomerase/thioredoxin
MCLGLTLHLSAQSFFQDFESGIAPMALFNLDGRAPNANVAAYANAWNAAAPGFGNGTNVAISTSWLEPVGIANRWMVTPLISLPDTNNVILRWDAKAQDASFPDGYIVYISTTGNVPDSFSTVLFQRAAEVATWTTRQVSLSAYAGQDVYIAFRNNSNDQFLLLVDNIFVGEQKQRDVSLIRVGANINRGTSLEGEHTLAISIQNFGIEAITSLDATWNFNGETQTQKLTGINVASGAAYTFNHSSKPVFEVGTGYQLNVTIDSINGTEDQEPANNAYTSSMFKVFPPVPNITGISAEGVPIDLYETLASGKAVIFDFFASWCVPCEISTPALNDLYVANGSGTEDLAVFGITIEPGDDDADVLGLDWGGTYPNLSYTIPGIETYVHYNDNHGLGESAIPFFVMICPNLDDLAHSEILLSHIGTSDIVNTFNNTWQAAKDACTESLVAVKDIPTVESVTVYPNPATEFIDLDMNFSATTNVVLQVLDVTGKVIIARDVRTFVAGQHHEQFDVSGLANGTYFVKLTEKNRVNTLKFTVIK